MSAETGNSLSHNVAELRVGAPPVTKALENRSQDSNSSGGEKRVFEVLGRVSGLGTAEVDKIAAGVRENNRKLDACHVHEFEPAPDLSSPLRSKFRCTACGGVIGQTERLWFERGRIDQLRRDGTN